MSKQLLLAALFFSVNTTLSAADSVGYRDLRLGMPLQDIAKLCLKALSIERSHMFLCYDSTTEFRFFSEGVELVHDRDSDQWSELVGYRRYDPQTPLTGFSAYLGSISSDELRTDEFKGDDIVAETLRMLSIDYEKHYHFTQSELDAFNNGKLSDLYILYHNGQVAVNLQRNDKDLSNHSVFLKYSLPNEGEKLLKKVSEY